MKGRALIDTLRETRGPVSLLREEFSLLADAVEIADEAEMSLIECGCQQVEVDGRTWYDTRYYADAMLAEDQEFVARALSYLDRRGLIERKEGEAHLVKFMEDLA